MVCNSLRRGGAGQKKIGQKVQEIGQGSQHREHKVDWERKKIRMALDGESGVNLWHA